VKLTVAGHLREGPQPNCHLCVFFPFQILYNSQSVEVDGHSMKKLISDLQPDTDYSFVLMNRGNSAGGLQHLVSIRTAPDVLQSKPIATNKYIQEGKFTLTLPKVQTTVPVR